MKTPQEKIKEMEERFNGIMKVRKQLEECPIKEKVLQQALYLKLCKLQEEYGHESLLQEKLEGYKEALADVRALILKSKSLTIIQKQEILEELK